MLHPSFDACFCENFKGHLLESPKHEVLSVSQVVMMKNPGYCYQVLILKILFIFSIWYASSSDYICHFLSFLLYLPHSLLCFPVPSILSFKCVLQKMRPGTDIKQWMGGCLQFCRWRNRDTERSRNLTKFTQLRNARSGHFSSFKPLCNSISWPSCWFLWLNGAKSALWFLSWGRADSRSNSSYQHSMQGLFKMCE